MTNAHLIEEIRRWAGAYGNSPLEYAAVMNSRGMFTHQFTGTLDSVCLKRVKSAHYILHTHPKVSGCAVTHMPSIADLMAFFHLNPIGAVIVVGREAFYWPRPAKGWPLPEQVEHAYVHEVTKAHEQFPAYIYQHYDANTIMLLLANIYFPALHESLGLTHIQL